MVAMYRSYLKKDYNRIIEKAPQFGEDLISFVEDCFNEASFLQGSSQQAADIDTCLSQIRVSLKDLNDMDTEIEEKDTLESIEYGLYLAGSVIGDFLGCRGITAEEFGSFLLSLLPESGQKCLEGVPLEWSDIRTVFEDIRNKDSFFEDLAAVTQGILDEKSTVRECKEFLDEALGFDLE